MARKPQTFSTIQSLRDRYYRVLPGKESLIKGVKKRGQEPFLFETKHDIIGLCQEQIELMLRI